MTISSEVSSSGPYIGNGSTSVFPYEFKILDQTHIRAVLIDNENNVSELALGQNFSVSGVGAEGGGDVTLFQAPAVGEKITLVRSPPFTQETELPNQGAYFAQTVERRLDLTVMQIQAIRERLSRTFQVEPGQDLPTIDDIINAADFAARAEQALSYILSVAQNAYPLTVAALKAYDTGIIRQAFLKQAGMEGQFAWKTGNFADLVTYRPADYIAANGVSATVGAWVRIHDKLDETQIRQLPAISFADAAQYLALGDAAAVRRSIWAAPVEALASRALNHNGDHVVSQEIADTAVTNIGNSTVVNRWLTDGHQVSVKGSLRITGQRKAVTDLPGFTSALSLKVTTAQPAIGSDYIRLNRFVEGQKLRGMDWSSAKCRDLIRYFWVKSSIAGPVNSAVLNNGNTAVLQALYTINAPNTWEFKRVQYRGPLTDTWLKDVGSLGFTCADSFAGDGAMNLAATAGNEVLITGEILLPGNFDFGFRDTRDLMLPFEETLKRCQRYFAKSYNEGVPIGTPTNYPGIEQSYLVDASNFAGWTVRFPETMARTPAVTLYSPQTGLSGKGVNTNTSGDVAMVVNSPVGTKAFTARADNVAVASDNGLAFHWAADARIGYP